MGTKNNPGDFDCYANAHPDEPMFVLLGRDPSAPTLVESWAAEREHQGESPEKVAEARRCAESMRAWLKRIGKQERKPMDCGPGVLQVGIDPDRRQVVVELPRDLTGHIAFSPEQALGLARTLFRKASELVMTGLAPRRERLVGEDEESIEGLRYNLRTTLADVRAARPKFIYYAMNTCWWTFRESDLSHLPETSIKDGPGLPCDPRGSVLMMTKEGDVETFLSEAEKNPGHYGKHGLRAFEAALHGNVTLEGKPWSLRTWDAYNRLLEGSR